MIKLLPPFFIVACSTIAWFILGSTILARFHDSRLNI